MSTAVSLHYHNDDVCPVCGDWLPIVEATGWCASCTTAANPDLVICPCGALFKKSAQVSQCWSCRKEAWLRRHADEIEHYLLSGVTLTKALRTVADDIRPNCVICGFPIRGAREGRQFCRVNPECRAKAEQFTSLRTKGLTPDVALAIVTGNVPVLVSNKSKGE